MCRSRFRCRRIDETIANTDEAELNGKKLYDQTKAEENK